MPPLSPSSSTRSAPAGGGVLPSKWSVLAFAGVALLLAAGIPLLAYAGSLALFGLAHVLTELRYVDGRFGRRVGSRVGMLWIMLLGAAVGCRGAALAGWMPPDAAVVLEILLVGALAATLLLDSSFLGARISRTGRWIAALVVSVLWAGALCAPVLTLVVLACLHNATPVGFLYERVRAADRPACFGSLLVLVFLGLPLLLVTGWPAACLDALGLHAPSSAFSSVGSLGSNARVFVPPVWLDQAVATHLFSAVTYLQLVHYGAVLLVLPRLLGPAERVGVVVDRPVLPWPRARTLALLILGVSLVAAVSFVQDFHGTRASYGLIAAVHAWIEFPVLLWALGAVSRSGSPGGIA